MIRRWAELAVVLVGFAVCGLVLGDAIGAGRRRPGLAARSGLRGAAARGRRTGVPLARPVRGRADDGCCCSRSAAARSSPVRARWSSTRPRSCCCSRWTGPLDGGVGGHRADRRGVAQGRGGAADPAVPAAGVRRGRRRHGLRRHLRRRLRVRREHPLSRSRLQRGRQRRARRGLPRAWRHRPVRPSAVHHLHRDRPRHRRDHALAACCGSSRRCAGCCWPWCCTRPGTCPRSPGSTASSPSTRSCRSRSFSGSSAWRSGPGDARVA